MGSRPLKMWTTWVLFALTITLMIGCATVAVSLPPAEGLIAPTPIEGNNGKYMCPYTSDDVVAEWVDKAIRARIGATIGRTAGAYAGSEILEGSPLLGSVLGSMVGETIGRTVAIKSAGGWDYIRSTSDLSFNSVDDMAIYLYVKHSSHEHYQETLNATYEIYPELKNRYSTAIMNARRQL